MTQDRLEPRRRPPILERVRTDLAAGDRAKALQRLRSLGDQHPDRIDIRELIADQYLATGDLFNAGRWRYFSRPRDTRDEQAHQMFTARFPWPDDLMATLRMRTPIDDIPDPVIRAKLSGLRTTNRKKFGWWYDYDQQQRRWRPHDPRHFAKTRDHPWLDRLIPVAIALAFLWSLFLMLLGAITIAGWIRPWH